VRILRLHLQDFRRHHDLEIVPAAGLTAIVGPNEAGKSSIQEALEMVLFRKAESAAQATQEVQRWGSAGPPRVTLEFEAAGTACRLEKVFAGSRGSVELVVGEEVLRDPNHVQRRVAELTGISGEKFFRSTASVRHHELTELGSDDHQINDRLQQVVSGVERGTAQAKRMLEEAIRRYRTEGAKNPGLLKVEREGIAVLERELAQGEAALVRLESDRAGWVAAHQRRVELDRQVVQLQAEMAECDRAAALVDRREEAQARYERLRRACELDEERRAIEESAPLRMPLPQLRAHVARIESTVFEVSELEAALAVAEAAGAPAELPVPAKPWPFIVAAALLTVAALVAYLALDRTVGLVVVIALAALAILSLAWSVRVARRARRVDLDAAIARAAQEQHGLGSGERDEAYRRKRRDLESLLEAVAVETPEAAAGLLAAAEARIADLARIDGELRGLLGDVRPEDLPAERDRAANEAERARHALEDMAGTGEDPVASVRRLRSVLASTLPARDAARSEEDRVLGRIEGDPADADAVAVLAERLDEARTRLAAMQHRMGLYEATLDAIRRAEAATMKTAARFLEERMGPDLALITGGRYARIRVDERDLSFRVWSGERGGEVAPSVLSRGTADQLYLVARLGLVSLVTMDRRPPLILDDPFVTFDDDRAARALDVVKRLSTELGIQVIHLTASERLLDLADAVVRLPEPGVVGPPPPEREDVLATPAAPVRRPEAAWPSAALSGSVEGAGKDGAPLPATVETLPFFDDDGWRAESHPRPDEPAWPVRALARPGGTARTTEAEPNPRPEEPAWPAEALRQPGQGAPTADGGRDAVTADDPPSAAGEDPG
jgi:DNA repair exonuclease SbcCD ATPase subunit